MWKLCNNLKLAVTCIYIKNKTAIEHTVFFFMTGVLVERLMECPLCRELSFLGEWMTPKETQGMETRPCEECMQEVDTAFLVQPREKKRGMGFRL